MIAPEPRPRDRAALVADVFTNVVITATVLLAFKLEKVIRWREERNRMESAGWVWADGSWRMPPPAPAQASPVDAPDGEHAQ